MTQYVAYADLGKGTGAPVDPEDHGGEDSPDWKYLVEHRIIVPAGDPDAPAPPEGYEVRQVGRGENAEKKVVETKESSSSGPFASESKTSSASSQSGAQPTTSPKTSK